MIAALPSVGVSVFVAPRGTIRGWTSTFRIFLSYKQVISPVEKALTPNGTKHPLVPGFSGTISFGTGIFRYHRFGTAKFRYQKDLGAGKDFGTAKFRYQKDLGAGP